MAVFNSNYLSFLKWLFKNLNNYQVKIHDIVFQCIMYPMYSLHTIINSNDNNNNNKGINKDSNLNKSVSSITTEHSEVPSKILAQFKHLETVKKQEKKR